MNRSVLVCLLPAQLLARWTAADRRLGARVTPMCCTSICGVPMRSIGALVAAPATARARDRVRPDHPRRDLDRLTFRSARDGHEAEGLAALARALEHIHLCWAFVSWTLRLPVVGPVAQLLVDIPAVDPVESLARPTR
ncbi:MAG: hypothetical protein LC797_12880 [Chloroflexi bacterium]|nr:hypothetical protein [Chloroflexota bacterium]